MSRKAVAAYDNSRKNVRAEVDKLIAKGVTRIDTNKLAELHNTHSSSDLVDLIVETLASRVETIRGKARRMARAILDKVGENVPLHTLLKKALALRDRMELSDVEFEFFTVELKQYLQGKTDERVQYEQGIENPMTNLGRIFGPQTNITPEMRVEQKDSAHLQHILKTYNMTKTTHANVVIQSMLYQDVADRALLAKYDNTTMNMNCYIDPVLVAMFLPKIRLFEEVFLFANISYIVKCKHERKNLLTGPDEILLRHMVGDATDVVCDFESPFKDLVRRVDMQVAIWQNVFALRTGRYYDCISNVFNTAVDNCKISTMDAPDAIAIGDDSVTLRRIMAAFALRPTMVVSQSIPGLVNNVGLEIPVLNNRVTTVPMIPIRLGNLGDTDGAAVDLNDALSAPQYYNEGGVVIPKTQTIVYTREVLIFNAVRRIATPRGGVQVAMNFHNVAPVVNVFEKVNTREVAVQETFSIAQNSLYAQSRAMTLHLRSAVIVNVNPNVPDLIIGSATILREPKSGVYVKYDPYIAGFSMDDADNKYGNGPIRLLGSDETDALNQFYHLLKRYSTILIFGPDPANETFPTSVYGYEPVV